MIVTSDSIVVGYLAMSGAVMFLSPLDVTGPKLMKKEPPSGVARSAVVGRILGGGVMLSEESLWTDRIKRSTCFV
jgi:hypothetical protein